MRNPFKLPSAVNWMSPAGLIVGILGFLLVLFVVWWIFIKPGQDHAKAVQQKADTAMFEGRAESAMDSVQAHQDNANEEKEYDAATAEGNAGIRGAQGSDAAVDRATACASVRAQCMQRSYRGSEQCIRMLKSCE